jgi:hypothetical protein
VYFEIKMHNGEELTRDEVVEWHKCVAKKGWMGHSWPVEHATKHSEIAVTAVDKKTLLNIYLGSCGTVTHISL